MESRLVSYDLFKAIAHPCRREMLLLIARGEASVAQIMDGLAGQHRMTRPAIAKHLGLLLRAGLLSETWRGREHVYRMAAGRLDEVTRWVERVGAVEMPISDEAPIEAPIGTADRELKVRSSAQTTSENVRRSLPEGAAKAASRDGEDRAEREWQVW